MKKNLLIQFNCFLGFSYNLLFKGITKPLVFSLFLLFFQNAFSQAPSSCLNSDFEQGDFGGWLGAIGTCCPVNTPTSGIVSGRHTIMSGNGTDPNTCNVVTYVAPGGTYSARLGNSNTGAEAEKLLYVINVTASTSIFIYKYAVVLQDPTHLPAEQPRFDLRVLNSAGQVIDPVCGQYSVNAGANIPGFQTCNSAGPEPVVFKDWTAVGLNLTPYLGQTITMEFSTGDCSLGGHFGYAYIDAFCSPLNILTSYCQSSVSAVLTAPLGFSYLWSTGATTQSINVNNPTSGQLFSVLLTSPVGGCQVSINTILYPVDPTPNFSLTNLCYNNAVFQNTTTTPTNTYITSWLWNFGDGATSASTNPVHPYSAAGTYTVSLTATNSAGCIQTYTVPVNVNPIPVVTAPSQTICPTQTATLTASGASSFGWSAGPVVISPTTAIVSPLATTTYTITGIANGCIGRGTVTVTVLPSPSVSVPVNLSVCGGSSVTVTNFTSNVAGATFTWTNNNASIGLAASGSGNLPTFNAINNGNNPVNAVINVTPSANGCTGPPSTFTITVSPTANVNVPPNALVCNGANVNAANFSGVPSSSIYSWTNSDPSIGLGASGNGNIPSFPAINTGSTLITATITVTPTFNGCVGNLNSYLIRVKPTPDVIVPSSITVCNGVATLPIQFNTNTPGATFNWVNSNINIGLASNGSGATIPSFVANNSGAATATAVITVTPTLQGCVGAPVTFTITVNPRPVALVPASISLCSGSITPLLSFTSTPNGGSFSWTNSNINIGLVASGSGDINPFNLPSTTSSINSTISVTTTLNGCTSLPVTTSITDSPGPDVIMPADVSVCNGSNVPALNFSSSVIGTTYSWTNNNITIGLGASGNGNISSFASVNSGNTVNSSVITVVPSANGCVGPSGQMNILISPAPTITLPADISICGGVNVAAANFISNPVGATYSWTNSNVNIGLASSGIGNTPAFVSTNSGSGVITATVQVTPTLNTCVGTPSQYLITVNPSPAVSISDVSVCNGTAVPAINFTSVTSGSTFSWANNNTAVGLAASGNGNIASFAGFNATSSSITAQVAVTPTANGCVGNASNFNIVIKPTPTVTVPSSSTVCGGVAIASGIFTSTPAGGTFVWTNSNAAIGLAASGIGNTPAFTAINSGVTPVLSTISATPTVNGCAGISSSYDITVNPLPVPDFSHLDVCLHEPVVFTDLTLGNTLSWNWNFGDASANSSLTNPTHLYTNAGSYNVDLTITSSLNCINHVVKVVKVHALPVSAFTAAPVCKGVATSFVNNSTVASPDIISSNIWKFGDNSAHLNTASPTHSYNSDGSYTVQLNVTSNFGCMDSSTAQVFVNPIPVVDFMPNDSSCSPLCVNFSDLSTITSGVNQSWLWSFGDGNTSSIQNANHCYVNPSHTAAMRNSVTLTVTSDHNCAASLTKPNYEVAFPVPTANFDFTPKNATVLSPTIYFQNTSFGGTQWLWDFGDTQPGHTSTAFEKPYKYIDSGQYIVTLLVKNSYGCKDSVEKIVIIGTDWGIYIPNAFTPNNDVTNENFTAVGHGIKEFEMCIYNRWGELVFKTNDIKKGWDGRMTGKDAIVQEDVYVYKINVLDIFENKHNYIGQVTVVK